MQIQTPIGRLNFLFDGKVNQKVESLPVHDKALSNPEVPNLSCTMLL